jgi:hypothetical protein
MLSFMLWIKPGFLNPSVYVCTYFVFISLKLEGAEWNVQIYYFFNILFYLLCDTSVFIGMQYFLNILYSSYYTKWQLVRIRWEFIAVLWICIWIRKFLGLSDHVLDTSIFGRIWIRTLPLSSKKVRKILLSTVLWLLFDLSLKNDVNGTGPFLIFCWRKEDPDPWPDPDTLSRVY